MRMEPAPTLNATPIYLKLPRVAVAPALVPRMALTLAVVAGAVPVSDADLRGATDGLLVEIARVRRLSPKVAPPTLERRLEAPAASRARRAAELAASAADPELAARLRLWAQLGLVPAGAGADKLVGSSLDASATASYDPLARRLFVPDWIPLADQRPALAHALAHALDDQRFGLRDFLGIDLEGRHHLDGDVERARLALVEGDAALTALDLDDARGALTGGHALPALTNGIAEAPAPRGAPAWARVLSSFAHADGLAFVARVRGRQPWSAVDALWKRPAALVGADPPSREVRRARGSRGARSAEGARARGPREAASDVLGELGARTWLALLGTPEVIAERAAAGWGGDRAILFETSEADGGASLPRATRGAWFV